MCEPEPISISICYCVRCGVGLRNQGDRDLHPEDGVCFQARGNYGSTVWDPTPSEGRGTTKLEIVVCDDCIVKLSKRPSYGEHVLVLAPLSHDNHWFDPEKD